MSQDETWNLKIKDIDDLWSPGQILYLMVHHRLWISRKAVKLFLFGIFFETSLYERAASPPSNDTKFVRFHMGKKLKQSVCNLDKTQEKICIENFRHLVLEYRRTQYIFPLNWACAFQPDGFWPRLNCLTSWLNWFFNLNKFENQSC